MDLILIYSNLTMKNEMSKPNHNQILCLYWLDTYIDSQSDNISIYTNIFQVWSAEPLLLFLKSLRHLVNIIFYFPKPMIVWYGRVLNISSTVGELRSLRSPKRFLSNFFFPFYPKDQICNITYIPNLDQP